MKLLRLVITGRYKNIDNQVMEFSDCGYTALVGENGSGKSNWIEAIAAVLIHLLEGQEPSFSYRLYLDNGLVAFSKEIGLLFLNDEGATVEKDEISLPKRVIACYSGEDSRLWNDFFLPSYVRFFGETVLRRFMEPKVLFLNKYHWAIALIALLCSDNEEVKTFVKELWGEEVPLNQIKVDIAIDADANGYQEETITKFLRQIVAEQEGLYMSHIKSFDIGQAGMGNNDYCRRLYYLLYLLAMPVTSPKGIKMQKAIKSISITSDNGISLSNLSEGHKKRILIMLMTRVLGDDNTVYLLDEPDAHVDVSAKSKIVSLIATAKGHVVLTTHSPLLTSHLKHDAVNTIINGEVRSNEWKDVFNHLSANQISQTDNFLFTFKRKVVITEGPLDVKYIRQAVKMLKPTHPEVQKLDEVAFFSQNGAGSTKEFLTDSLKPIVDYFEKVVFLFDRDKAGQDALNDLLTFIRQEHLAGKLSGFMYADTYSPEPAHDFLLEDFFPASCYVGTGVGQIGAISINGTPAYYELKKFENVEGTIKSYIKAHYAEAAFDANVYAKFLPLLQKLITELAI